MRLLCMLSDLNLRPVVWGYVETIASSPVFNSPFIFDLDRFAYLVTISEMRSPSGFNLARQVCFFDQCFLYASYATFHGSFTVAILSTQLASSRFKTKLASSLHLRAVTSSSLQAMARSLLTIQSIFTKVTLPLYTCEICLLKL